MTSQIRHRRRYRHSAARWRGCWSNCVLWPCRRWSMWWSSARRPTKTWLAGERRRRGRASETQSGTPTTAGAEDDLANDVRRSCLNYSTYIRPHDHTHTTTTTSSIGRDITSIYSLPLLVFVYSTARVFSGETMKMVIIP